ncbi:hypothetical protein J6590_045881 [Homalodisca vitripennis]|nr:hypothetical protein J6590_045881 [Homalodisca vitripennis]
MRADLGTVRDHAWQDKVYTYNIVKRYRFLTDTVVQRKHGQFANDKRSGVDKSAIKNRASVTGAAHGPHVAQICPEKKQVAIEPRAPPHPYPGDSQVQIDSHKAWGALD